MAYDPTKGEDLERKVQANPVFQVLGALPFVGDYIQGTQAIQGMVTGPKKTMRFDTEGKTEPLREAKSWSERAQEALMLGLGAMGPFPVQGRAALQKLRRFFNEDMYSKEGRLKTAADPYLKKVTDQATAIFHGTKADPEKVAREGLKLSGRTTIPGEASGVSLTTRPSMAQNFGSTPASQGRAGVFRVHPGVEPESVARTYVSSESDDYRDAIRKASKALEDAKFYHNPWASQSPSIPEWRRSDLGPGMSWEEMLSGEGRGPNRDLPKDRFADLVRQHLSMEGRAELGAGVRDYLKEKGYSSVLYHPRRYDEYELRHLDPQQVQLIEYRLDPTTFHENPRAYPVQEELFGGGGSSRIHLPRRFVEQADRTMYQHDPEFGQPKGVKTLLDEAIRERFGFPAVGQTHDLNRYHGLPDNMGLDHPYVTSLIDKTYSNNPPNIPMGAWEKLSSATKNYLTEDHANYFTIDGQSVYDHFGGDYWQPPVF